MAIARAAARIRRATSPSQGGREPARPGPAQRYPRGLSSLGDDRRFRRLPPDHLLPEALLVRHKSRLGLAFRLLEIRYPSRTIQLVYSRNLGAESKAVRANALELIST